MLFPTQNSAQIPPHLPKDLQQAGSFLGLLENGLCIYLDLSSTYDSDFVLNHMMMSRSVTWISTELFVWNEQAVLKS